MRARHVFEEVDLIYTNASELQQAVQRIDDNAVAGASGKVSVLKESYKLLDQKLIIKNPPQSFNISHKHQSVMPKFEVNPNLAM